MAKYHPLGPTNFKELVEPLPKPIVSVATQLREIIKTTVPEADESFHGGAKMGMALYSIDGPNNVVCGFQPAEDMCKLFFHNWDKLKEVGYRLDGTGKNARHIKIKSTQEIERDEITKMIRIAQCRE
jgi:hypothetical protein